MDGADETQSALARLFVGGARSKAVTSFDLPGGRVLFGSGDPADTLYFVRTGRLGVLRHEEGREQEFIGVIRSGEPVGEMALIAGTPHTATVIAMRDSEILQLPRTTLLAEAQERPEIMAELARLMILRVRETGARSAASDPTVFGFVGLSPEVQVRGLLEAVRHQLATLGFQAVVVGKEAVHADPDFYAQLEQQNHYVLYAADAADGEWVEVCGRQVDRLALVGMGDARPPRDAKGLISETVRQHRLVNLVLLHGPRVKRPRGATAWLDALDATHVLHLRQGDDAHVARLARLISGTAVALVLSGGGSRAYAHIGAIKALHEAGQPIDVVGGCSMGAIIGAGLALGWTDTEIERRVREAFVESSPVADLAFPMIAMTRGQRVQARLKEHFGEVDIADLWLPFFCVSSNLTTGVHQVHRRGKLVRALTASSAVPGVLPPVVDGQDVLVDGAVLRNFPADVMRSGHRGPIVGVDVSRSRGVTADDLVGPPSVWRWLLSGDWLKGPPIVSLLMRSATVSSMRDIIAARDATDLLVLPDVKNIEIRDWKAFEPAVKAGHEAAAAGLAALHGPLTHLRRRKAEAARKEVALPTGPANA
jgi:NTE family protein